MSNMLIREVQMEAMSESFNDDYINRIIPSLKKDCPEQCSVLGDDELRKIARYGLDHSKLYGITTETNVYCYIEMMILFGKNFDVDPDKSWASEILNNNEFIDEDEKTDFLCDAASEHLDKLERSGR